MMINLPHIHTTNIESTMCTTEVLASSASSFQKPESSKRFDYGESSRTEIEIQRWRGQHQGEENTHAAPLRKSCLKSSTSTPLGEKSVNFQKTARVRRVRPRNHFSKQEAESMWYNEDEYASIKRGAVDTVRRMSKAEKSGRDFVDDENYSSRGLECRMRKNAVARKEFKAFARELVLTEQNDQNASGILSSSAIRKVYLKASSIASMKAQDSGRKDEEAVNDLHLSDILPIVTLEQSIF